MAPIFTAETVGARVAERGLKPGDRLWAAGDKIAGDAYRLGNSDKNPALYLRWRDIGVVQQGKIESEQDQRAHMVSPGQGLSLFVEKVVHADFNLLASRKGQSGKAALKELAAERGYSDVSQIHWFKLEEGRVMPAGLQVTFDGEPPGHCTLTVTWAMSVKDFLDLVQTHLGFVYVGTDIFGIK